MGSGHDTVAAELVRRARAAGKEAQIVDVLELLPWGLGTGLRGGYQAVVRHCPWVYAGVYDLFLRPGPRPRPSGTPLARLAGDRLLELVRRSRADLVVPVFHLAAQLTGHLRAHGTLRVPSAVVVVDFAVHRQWLHPGNDLHLCLTDRAADEVRAALGRPARVTGPVVDPAFFAGPAPGTPEPTQPSESSGAPEPSESSNSDSDPHSDSDSDSDSSEWRRRFEPYGPGRPAVLVSAGAWGAGARLHRTARLLAAHGYLPVVLCGRNDRLRRALSTVPGVLTPGWVTDMPALLRACAALVDNAAGQTAVQALAAGLPVVGYRPLPGHGAEGVRRMAAAGVSDHVPDEAGLLASLARLTARGPERERRVAAGRALFRADALAEAVRPPG
ncbi:MGDG synthase family glycosyltransferase [Streptomyces sp. SAT1]|uniref:MGDG synthase family glycosyltransferase n=1 Tax=Streptomyces sp. SAT1 TaxID=1849967 RepID=UPI001F3E24EB|nr:galactosyldiacylglycerol synthase [Streptomyces sp. SAT1]